MSISCTAHREDQSKWVTIDTPNPKLQYPKTSTPIASVDNLVIIQRTFDKCVEINGFIVAPTEEAGSWTLAFDSPTAISQVDCLWWE